MLVIHQSTIVSLPSDTEPTKDRAKTMLISDKSTEMRKKDGSEQEGGGLTGYSHQIGSLAVCKKLTTRIIVSLTVTQGDFGLQLLYQQLAALASAVDRVQHVKRILFEAVSGKINRAETKDTDFSKRLASFKIQFPINAREIGLEWLYRDLSAMTTATERNLHIRKLLYQACSGSIQGAAAVSPDQAFILASPKPETGSKVGYVAPAVNDEKSRKRKQGLFAL